MFRKFEVLDITISPGSGGPEQVWKVRYKAIKNKLWIEDTLFIIARTKDEAKKQAEARFGGKK